ncbi:TIGR02677 family protein [Micromonospora sp. NPDC005324]|uniref:TIGR02677 family protein n=1 Tax=Micromonospora sp. NPDC005324 TaxID=3157033 RepID=UPI0033BBF8A7
MSQMHDSVVSSVVDTASPPSGSGAATAPASRQRAGRRTALADLAAYVSEAPYHILYWAILDVFLQAAAAYQSRLRVDEVLAALRKNGWTYPLSESDLEDRLTYLFEHGNLTRDYDYDDTAMTLERYDRRLHIYDLTPEGEVVHDAMSSVRDSLQRVGGLQAVLLRQIMSLLDDLLEQLEDPDPDGEVVFTRVEDLRSNFKAMTSNAALFMQQVNRMLATRSIDVEAFRRFKDDTIAYLAGFLAELDELTPDIRKRTLRLRQVPDPVRHLALARAARASGHKAVDGREAFDGWIAAAKASLDGVSDWFTADRGASTGIEVLSAKARQAVLGITHAVERIREAGSQPSARTSDLLALASMFDRAAGDEVHAIWKAAFGLTSSRHFGDLHSDSDLTPDGLLVRQAPRIEVSLKLQAIEVSDTVKQAPRLPDHSATRQVLAGQAREEIAAVAAAAETLVALGQRHLSELNTILDRATLKLLAKLIFRAQKARPDSQRWQQAASVDGRLRVRVRAPRPARATVVCAIVGDWVLPDYEVQVSSAAPGREKS